MIVEEGPPRLRGRLAWLRRHESGHAALADVDAELEQLAVDSGRAPAHVGLGHLSDERLDIGGDVAPRRAARAGLPSPDETETGTVPADHGVWPDDDQHLRRARPESGEDEPEDAVDSAQERAARGAPQVGQLLAQGEVLKGEVGLGAEGGSLRAKEAQEQREHRAMMYDGGLAWPGPLSFVVTVGKPGGG